MNKEYLPSKKFVASVLIIAIGLSLVLGISKLATYVKGKFSPLSGQKKLLVKDLVQKDSNENGIPDWEESLWGLDPNKNGPENKDFILAKRAALAKDNTIPDTNSDIAPSKENEALSQEFFAVIMSLEQSGNLDSDALSAVSDAIGKKIVADPIADIYSKNKLIIVDEDTIETIKFYTAYVNLHTKYKDRNIGDELTFIATALKNNDSGALKQVTKIGQAYKTFSEELIKIPVPANLVTIDVNLANDYYKVSKSIDGLSNMLVDPITGMKALINYKKYSDALVNDIGILSDNFK